jgi:mannose-6-phosphate isomerase-like protein (cupin superfamily)
MKRAAYEEAETIPRDYGAMIMLGGGANLRTKNGDLRILQIRAGASTSKHYHKRSESIFHVLSGELVMEVDNAREGLRRGDTIVIEPEEIHVLRNVGAEDAVVVETMAPPFSKTDIFYLPDE